MPLASAIRPALVLVAIASALVYSTFYSHTAQAHGRRDVSSSAGQRSAWWTPHQIDSLKSLSFSESDANAVPAADEHRYNRMPPLQDRNHRETVEVWQPPFESILSHKQPRPHMPSVADYEQAGSLYLQSSIPGDFRAGSDKIFLMYKTGADTMWKRTIPHFFTTFPKYVNFALYSDTAGSIFGHEVIDILKDMPPLVHVNQADFSKHRALDQMHDERWGWSPEKLQAEGGWNLDKYKNLPILWDAYQRNPNCDWYVMVDDDGFIFHDNLVRFLADKDPSQPYYTGNPGNSYIGGKWVGFAHGGSLIVCSRGLVELMFGPERKIKETIPEFLDKWANRAITTCCGDLHLAEILYKEFGYEMNLPHVKTHHLVGIGGPFQANEPSGIVMVEDHLCNPLITFHHLDMHDMEMLYQYERMWTPDRYMTYSDYYRDFMLPYIVEERPNWLITSDHKDEWHRPNPEEGEEQEHTYLWADGIKWYPAESKDQCHGSCKAYKECGAWSYRDGECRHSDHGLTLGRAANSLSDEQGWVTGYMVDRMREWRAASPCDPLQRDVNGNYNDDDSTSEGWYLRQYAELNEHQRRTWSHTDSTIAQLWVPPPEPEGESDSSIPRADVVSPDHAEPVAGVPVPADIVPAHAEPAEPVTPPADAVPPVPESGAAGP